MKCDLSLFSSLEDSDVILADVIWKFTETEYTDYRTFIREVIVFQSEHGNHFWNPDVVVIKQPSFTLCYYNPQTRHMEVYDMEADNGVTSVSYTHLQNVINVTDTAFLGRVGEVALGASAMGGLFYICVFTIAFGFSTGSQIVIARRNGEGRYSDVGPVMIQGVMFMLLMALLLFSFTKAFGGNIMRMLVSSESIYDATMEFLDWRIYGRCVYETGYNLSNKDTLYK